MKKNGIKRLMTGYTLKEIKEAISIAHRLAQADKYTVTFDGMYYLVRCELIKAKRKEKRQNVR